MVDKLYIMLPEFSVTKYDYAQAKRDFKGSSETMKELAKIFNNDKGLFTDIANAPLEFKDWFERNKEKYKLDIPVIRKVKYNYDKLPQEQTLEARNNALIDMMWSVLTHADTASKLLNPGGFDKQKSAARVVTILDSITEDELVKEGYTIPQLLELPLDALDKLAKKYKNKVDPLSPRTQVIFHQQNMTGARMIGIYANHNANHAIMQYTELELNDNGSFNFAGKKKTSLHDMKNEEGDFISRNTANYLAASVDNVKDNTLHATNQNTFTGDATMLLSRLGYNPTEIAVLMRQPIVMEITDKYFKGVRDGKSKLDVIDEVISRYNEQLAGNTEKLEWKKVQNNKFNLDVLMKDILLNKSLDSMSDKEKIYFYRRQAAAGVLFKRIMESADALAQVVAATRADTGNGGAGPTIADTIIKIQKVEDLLENVYKNEKFPLSGANIITDGIEYDPKNVDALRQRLLSSKLPYLQAFYTLGLRQTERIMGQYFPQFSTSFKEVINGMKDDDGNYIFEGLRQLTKSKRLDVKTMNSIYNDLFAYIMSKTDFFGDSVNPDGTRITSSQKRSWFINNFPKYFKKLVSENEDIAELEFIQRLKTDLKNDKNPVNVLVFKNVGKLSPTLRERYTRDWTSLLYLNNPKANKLALGLFLYSYYRNGFAFGPSTFIHLAPAAIREAIVEYIPTLRDILNYQGSYQEFIEQYIFNHLDNRKLVPSIPDESSVSFTTDKGVILDNVKFSISRDSSYANKTVVRESKKVGEETQYKFFNFIGKKIKGKWYYYRMIPSESSNTTVTYERIEPLGYKNSFLEYEYGKFAFEIESVIDKNIKGEDPVEEYASMHMNNENVDDLISEPIQREDTSDEYFTSMANQVALEVIYGKENTPAPSMDLINMDEITPNTDYRDANDNELCSGKFDKFTTVAKF